MPRTTADPRQMAEVYRWLEAGLDASSIYARIKQTFGETAISKRQIYRYIEKYQPGSDGLTLENINSLNLPKDAVLKLLDLWELIREVSDAGKPTWPLRTDNSRPDITLGEAGWYVRLWQILEGMPDGDRLPEADVFLLAAVCDHRERASGPSGRNPNFDDVVSYLAFRPWVNQNRHYRYMRAVKAGTIAAALDYMELMAVALAKSSGPKDPPFKNIRTSNHLPGLYSDYPEEFLEADYRETGPFPKPLQLLAWAKLSFYLSNLGLPDEFLSGDADDAQLADNFVASEDARAFWSVIPPFGYDYSELGSISMLLNYDSTDQFEDIQQKYRNEWTVLIRNLPAAPDPTRPQLESALRPDLWVA